MASLVIDGLLRWAATDGGEAQTGRLPVDFRYSERYRELYLKHWWWRARTEIVLDRLRRLQPRTGWGTILDIGCGDGLFFDQLSQFGSVEGVESCAELVSSDNPYRNSIHICPFDEQFKPGRQYALVLMLDVLEHFENPVAALRHAVDLLRDNGMLVVTVPAFMALWTNHDVLNHHFTRYTKSRFFELARESGLDVREARYLYHWTCPVKLGVAFIERLFRMKPDPPKVPISWINEALYWISKAEQKTLSKLNMPFGSSLFAVCTKKQQVRDSELWAMSATLPSTGNGDPELATRSEIPVDS